MTLYIIILLLTVNIQVREIVGTESRELIRYKEKMEQRARQEEELFTRAPLTRMEKKKEKHLRKSRNGYVPYNFKFACSWCAKLYHQLSGKSFEQSDETGYLVL